MKKSAALLCVLLMTMSASAQYLQFKPYKPYKWLIGIGWNVVDDDGRPYTNLFNVAQTWNVQPYPTMLTVDRYLKYNLSVEAAASFNIYSGSTLINGVYRAGTFGALDITCRYSFYRFMQPMKWFDPYVGIGIGATFRDATTPPFVPMTHVQFGANFWIKNVGIRLQTCGKLGITGGFFFTETNYLQHSASILYRFPGKDKNKSSFDKRRYPWIHKKEKYKGKSK